MKLDRRSPPKSKQTFPGPAGCLQTRLFLLSISLGAFPPLSPPHPKSKQEGLSQAASPSTKGGRVLCGLTLPPVSPHCRLQGALPSSSPQQLQDLPKAHGAHHSPHSLLRIPHSTTLVPGSPKSMGPPTLLGLEMVPRSGEIPNFPRRHCDSQRTARSKVAPVIGWIIMSYRKLCSWSPQQVW